MAPEIFDRIARRAIVRRSRNSPREDRWLIARLVEEAIARLGMADHRMETVLAMGSGASDLVETAVAERLGLHIVQQACSGAKAVQFDEDRPPFHDGIFDAILVVGGFDSVSDIPGALIRARQMLRPGGTFIGSMAAAGSLAALRTAMSDLSNVPRFHPQIDVRAAGDLLVRAGFANPVTDLEAVSARYAGFGGLVRDLRANGLSNALPNRKPLGRRERDSIARRFSALAVDGRITETFQFVHMVARAP